MKHEDAGGKTQKDRKNKERKSGKCQRGILKKTQKSSRKEPEEGQDFVSSRMLNWEEERKLTVELENLVFFEGTFLRWLSGILACPTS